jgi:Electron transfer flavoprotein, alpha subunit
MRALVVAEPDPKAVKPATLATVTAARQIAGEVSVLVAGSPAAAEAASRIEGVGTVILAEDPAYAHPLAESLAPLIARLARQFSHVLAPATTFGKNVMPRVAALIDVAQISDIIAVDAPDTFRRPIYAGNAIATVKSSDPIKVITVRATAFEKAGTGGAHAAIATVPAAVDPGLASFVGQELSDSGRPELTAARVVISGGRGLQSAQNFRLIEEIADKLKAAIGASRAAVDAGFVPNDFQVGQTGKIVAPELYIAVGISGAIQHLAGMKDSKIIVAINKDEDAPIFQVADYGLVADLFEALPQFAAELETLKGA